MKKTTLCWLLLFSATLLINSSCSNDPLEEKPLEYPKNVYPITKAGADQTINIPVNSVILDGSDSTDPDKNISTYLWNKIQGPESFTIATPNAMQTMVSNLTEGIYTFELTVTDSEGFSTKDECSVTVRKNRITPIEDIQVLLPIDFCWLEPTYSDNIAIKSIVWKKTAGPSSYILESPDLLKTKVSKLEKGVYEFEISVTDTYGYTAKETAKVTVGEISANPMEKIFINLNWSCPWDCIIEIANITSQLPPGSTIFKVYIQKTNSTNWVEIFRWSTNPANNPQYYYFLDNGHLIITPYNYDTFNEKDTHNIKIVY